VATTYRRRAAPCSHCGDVVLVAQRQMPKLLGAELRWGPKSWLEHADPGPDGETDDPVDERCRRPRVR
jgi:hypothetical protein